MCALASVGVDDNLASCQSCVAMRTADDKLAGGVDKVYDVIVEEAEHVGVFQLALHTWYEDILHVLAYCLEHGVVVGELVVLCRHHDGVYALWDVVVVILYCHLRF